MLHYLLMLCFLTAYSSISAMNPYSTKKHQVILVDLTNKPTFQQPFKRPASSVKWEEKPQIKRPRTTKTNLSPEIEAALKKTYENADNYELLVEEKTTPRKKLRAPRVIVETDASNCIPTIFHEQLLQEETSSQLIEDTTDTHHIEQEEALKPQQELKRIRAEINQRHELFIKEIKRKKAEERKRSKLWNNEIIKEQAKRSFYHEPCVFRNRYFYLTTVKKSRLNHLFNCHGECPLLTSQ